MPKPIHLAGIWKIGSGEMDSPTYLAECDEHSWQEGTATATDLSRAIARHIREIEKEESDDLS